MEIALRRPAHARLSRRLPTTALVAALALPAAAAAQEPEVAARAEAARAAPRDHAAQRAYGEALLRAGRFAEARRQMEKSARLDRTSLAAHYDVARVSFAEGDTRRARQACVALRRRDRAAALTHVCEARAFLAENRSARAFDALEAALAADADSVEAWLAMGDARRLRGELDAAKEAFDRARALAPERADVYLGLARVHAAARRPEPAVRAARRAVELDPADPVALFELAKRLPMGDEARGLLGRAVAGRPSWAEARIAYGDALLDAGALDEARAQYDAALEVSDTLAPAHVGLGRIHAQRGELDDAEGRFRRALDLVPNHVDAKVRLADVLAAKGQSSAAEMLYREAADADPTVVRPLLAAAALALRQGRDVTAAGYLARARALAPEHAGVLAALGDLSKARDERDRARDLYRRALAATEGRETVDRARLEAELR